MAVKARMRCNSNFPTGEGLATRQVSLSAVYSSDPDDPNFSYSQATPSALVTMFVSNPDASDAFEVGKTYDVEFTPVEG